jgi:O-antigen/teichoic acid export membrane protein
VSIEPESNIGRQVRKGVAWVALTSAVVAMMDFAASILIIRLWVSPADFGVVSLIITLFPAIELGAELGLSAAIINRSGHDRAQLSSFFWLNAAMACAVYAALFVLAPYYARWQNHEELTLYVRVFALMIPSHALYATHQALLKRELRFRELSVVRVTANTAEFVTKIACAYGGLGPWCFIWGPLARQAVYTIGMASMQRFVPAFVFQWGRIATDIRYGVKSAASEFLFQIYSNFDYQVVNKAFGPTAVASYRVAYEMILEPVRYLSSVIGSVAFPAISKMKHDKPVARAQFTSFLRQNMMVVMTLVIVLFVAAENAVQVVYGAQYLGSSSSIRILACVGVLRAMSHLGPPVLDGMGRSDLTLRYQLVAASTLSAAFVLFAVAMPNRSYQSVALAWAICYPLAFVALARMVVAQMGGTLRELLGSLRSTFATAAVSALFAALAQFATLRISPLISLLCVFAAAAAPPVLMTWRKPRQQPPNT